MFVTVAVTTLAGMDSLGKVLMQDLPIWEVVWARFFFHALVVVVIFKLQGYSDFLVPKAPLLQLLRGISMIGVTTSLYLAIKAISLAEATAFMYLSPVMVTLLAGVFLGERVHFQHIVAVILGFMGVLLITKPGFQVFQFEMILGSVDI